MVAGHINMPTYEYRCEKCGHGFEFFQSMNDDPLHVCPKEVCPQKKWGRGRVQRQIGAGAGLIFKGSGFYITDYRSDTYREAAKKDGSSTAAAATPVSPGGDTKSTPKSETKPASPPSKGEKTGQ
jgi:putative FmdB family regulatory protein